MERVPRIGIVCCCCLILLTTGPIVGTAQPSAAGESAATSASVVADGSTADQSEFDGGAQSASACFDGAGTEFVIGPPDGTHIWVRLHVGPFTDSGGALGAELIGSTGGNSIIEVIAGLQFVGDGFLEFLSSPGESVELVSGFDFQLPMLEAMTGEFTERGPSGADDGDGTANNSSAEGGEERGGHASDSRFQMLRC